MIALTTFNKMVNLDKRAIVFKVLINIHLIKHPFLALLFLLFT